MNPVLVPSSKKDSAAWFRVRKAGLDKEGQIHRSKKRSKGKGVHDLIKGIM